VPDLADDPPREEGVRGMETFARRRATSRRGRGGLGRTARAAMAMPQRTSGG